MEVILADTQIIQSFQTRFMERWQHSVSDVYERFIMAGKLMKAHLSTGYQYMASMWLAQQMKTIRISWENFTLWLFYCVHNWIVYRFNHSKRLQACILLLSYCSLLQRDYFMGSAGVRNLRQNFHSFDFWYKYNECVNTVQSTSLHNIISMPQSSSIFYVSQHSQFYAGHLPLIVPSTRIFYLFKYVTSRSVTWSQPSDQDGRRNHLILQLIWLFLEERQWVRYISWQYKDKSHPRK